MNIQAQRCISPNDVEAKLRWLIESEGPALLEVMTDQKVNRESSEIQGAGLSSFRCLCCQW